MEFTGHILRTKAFIYQCECEHRDSTISTSTKDLLQNKFKTRIDISTKRIYNNILNEIASHSFFGYASLLIIFEFPCQCKIENFLPSLYKAIKSNVKLKYVTKIILTHTSVNFNRDNLHFEQKVGKKRIKFDLNREKELKSLPARFSNNETVYRKQLSKMMFFKEFKTSTSKPTRIVPVQIGPSYGTYIDNKFLENEPTTFSTVDNSILVQFRNFGLSPKSTAFATLLAQLNKFGLRLSVQTMATKIVNKKDNWSIYSEIVHFEVTSTMGCYVFNINPALAIVMNHINFTGLSIREASINDIQRLKETYISKRIPLIILEDGSVEEVQRIMHFVENMQFKKLKHLYITIMSHGDEGNIIYTKTDSYNIQETILDPLLRNESLQDTQKYVLINACRGSIDPRYEDFEDSEEYDDTNDTSNQDESLVTFYSAQRGYVSLLPKDGAVFIKQFCDDFGEQFSEKSMEEIAQDMERKLQQKMRFCDKVTEYCVKPGSVHNIRMEFKNVLAYSSLHKNICQLIESGKNLKNTPDQNNENCNSLETLRIEN